MSTTPLEVSIEYCGVWNYEPRASRLEAEIKQAFPGVRVELIRSSGGVFEVRRAGELIYSKKRTGRHPEWSEIRDLLS